MLELHAVMFSLGEREVLHNVSLAVAPGELVALTGPSGAGKSTLGLLASGALLAGPGMVHVDDIDPTTGEAAHRAHRRLVGMVRQDPVDQIVSTVVFDEVAFGPRNLGLSEDVVSQRASEALDRAGLSGFETRNTATLSGGELQRLALAGVLAMHPHYLVLDEVTSMLDGSLRPALRELFVRLAHKDGVGILTITHDAAELAQADRVITLEPTDAQARDTKEIPFDDLALSQGADLELRGVSFCYLETARPVFNNVSCMVRAGEVLLLQGASGAGKSTLAMVAAGLLQPTSGKVLLGGKPVSPGDVGIAFQRSEAQFFLDTVFDELAYAPRNFGCSEDEVSRRVYAAAACAGLELALLRRYPYELSGGQQRRVSIASVLALDAKSYIFDEPTAGLDRAGKEALRRLIQRLKAKGKSIILITHDEEEWQTEADRVLILHDACLLEASKTEDALSMSRLAAGGKNSNASVLALQKADKKSAKPSRSVKPSFAGGSMLSFMHALDARVKIILLLSATIAVFAARPAIVLPLGYLALFAFAKISHMRLGALAKAVRPVAFILAFTLLANLVACDGSGTVFIAGGVSLNPAGGLRGLAAVLRIVLLLGFSLVVANTTTPPAICSACIRLMRPLAHVGVPTGDIGMALSIALRFIPVVAKEFQRIQMAQRARGARFDEGPVTARVSTYASVLTPLVIALFRRADRLAQSMAARLYEDGAAHTPPAALSLRDRIVLLGGIIVCVLIVVLGH